MGFWVDAETAACGLGDARLNRRLGVMLAAIGERPGKSLPTAFPDWANTKAAYRFFSNEKVSEDKILAGHFQASTLRVQATDGPILVLQDTTEFSFTRARAREDRLHQDLRRAQGEGRPLPPAHPLRPAAAREPRRHARRASARPHGGEVLVAGQVQGHEGAQAQDQPDPRADRAARRASAGSTTCAARPS